MGRWPPFLLLPLGLSPAALCGQTATARAAGSLPPAVWQALDCGESWSPACDLPGGLS